MGRGRDRGGSLRNIGVMRAGGTLGGLRYDGETDMAPRGRYWGQVGPWRFSKCDEETGIGPLRGDRNRWDPRV